VPTLPPFAYTIDALRVDNDFSADPIDYKAYSEQQVVGRELVAFLKAHLDSRIAPKGEKGIQRRPGQKAEGMIWDLEQGVVVAHRPTKADLERWSRTRWLTIDIYGRITPHEEREDPETLARKLLDRLGRRAPKR